MDPLVIVFGLGVGVLIGLTGIGGGSLMTPLLLLFVGTPPVTAIGTDLAYGAVTKTFGGWHHIKHKTVDFGLTWWMAAGSAPASLVGVWTVQQLHNSYGESFDDTLLLWVAIALLITSVATLGRALFMPKAVAAEQDTVEMTRVRKAQAVIIGAVLGFVLGLTSVGSGALIGLALILVFQLTPHRVVGTDVFHAAILLWVAGLANWFAGNVDVALMLNILVGSLPGVWIGTHLVTRVPARALRPTLGCVLMAAGIGVLSKSGVTIGPAVILGVPTVVGVAIWLFERVRIRRAPIAVAPARPVAMDAER